MKLRQYLAGQRYRKSLNRQRRLAMWKRCHGKCWYCGTLTLKSFFILDHVEPFSKGGPDSARNLVVSCPPCDKAKGAMNLEEFRTRRGGIQFYGEGRPQIPTKQEKRAKARVDVRIVRVGEALTRAGVCGHRAFDTVIEAVEFRNQVQRLTGFSAIFINCSRCGKWCVETMNRPSKATRNKLASLF